MSDKKLNTLFESVTGSQMWLMNRPDSDIDVTSVYLNSSMDILSGREGLKSTVPSKKFEENGVSFEYSYMELGHLIGLLCKGNVNAIWTVCSPVARCDPEGSKGLLKVITEKHGVTKDSFNSIRGMVLSQISDIEKKKDVMPPHKAARSAIRTCLFGQAFASEGVIRFDFKDKIPDEPTVSEDVSAAYNDMMVSFSNSKIPEHVDDSLYRTYLFQMRYFDLAQDQRVMHYINPVVLL